MRDFRNVIFILVVLTFLLQMYLMNADKEKESVSTKPIVAVSTFPLYDVVSSLSADTVEIVNILPFGVDVHSFEPTPKLVAALEKSALVIYSGAGLEPWTNGFEFKNRTVDMSKLVKLRELNSNEYDLHAHHDGQCVHNKIDPHYWLNVQNMKIAVEVVTQELIKISPSDRGVYEKNAKTYVSALQKLDEDYKRALSSCKNDTIITNHNAFSYLSSRYGFKVEALSGLSPEIQPSAKDVKRLIKRIEEEGVNTIFFESFVSDKIMTSLAKEVNVKVDVLQPLGNVTADEASRNLTYEEIMRENLSKLSKALMCK